MRHKVAPQGSVSLLSCLQDAGCPCRSGGLTLVVRAVTNFASLLQLRRLHQTLPRQTTSSPPQWEVLLKEKESIPNVSCAAIFKQRRPGFVAPTLYADDRCPLEGECYLQYLDPVRIHRVEAWANVGRGALQVIRSANAQYHVAGVTAGVVSHSERDRLKGVRLNPDVSFAPILKPRLPGRSSWQQCVSAAVWLPLQYVSHGCSLCAGGRK